MTASRALRDDPRVPEAERRRIQEVAAKMGYAPDPMLTALAAYRTERHHTPTHATLVFLDDSPTQRPRTNFRWFSEMLEGVRERGAALGYQVDLFELRSETRTAREASRILYHRGVSGLIVAPLADPERDLDFDWSHFSAVALGDFLPNRALHHAGHAHFQGMLRALDRLRALGYRRIGFAHSASKERGVDHRRLAACLLDQAMHTEDEPVPPLLAAPWKAATLLHWVRRERPDAIIGLGPEAVRWLRAAGFRVPEDIGVATLNRADPEDRITGIDQHNRQIGSAAVDLLHSLVLRREIGVPETPRGVVVHGEWFEGETTRRIEEASKARAISQRACVGKVPGQDECIRKNSSTRSWPSGGDGWDWARCQSNFPDIASDKPQVRRHSGV